MRTAEKGRIRNRAYRSHLRNVIKEVRTESNKGEALKKLREAVAVLDKAASRRLLHPKNVDRTKSRLAQHVNKLS
jgi:small subunit ribosomal protein S20